MANNTTIQAKRSASTGVLPTNLLANGEIALNLIDKRIFTTDTTGGAVFDAFQNTASNLAITGTTVQLSIGNSTINNVSNSSFHKIQNSTVSSTISVANVITTNVYASFYATGNVAAASQLGPNANSTNFLRGDLTFATPTAGAAVAGGPNTSVQYNNSTVSDGDADFLFDNTTNIVHLGNNTTGTFDVGNSTVNSISNSSFLKIQNSTVSSIISVANVVTTNVYASFYATGNIATAGQLGTGANSTNFLRGDLTFAAAGGGSPGGANTQVQFNDSAAFGGDAGFVYDKTIDTLSIVNSTSNVVVTPQTLSIGNSVANVFANNTTLLATNSTTNSVLSPSLLTIGNSTVTGSFSNTTLLISSNSTVNSITTDASIKFQGNSVANATLNTQTLSMYVGNTSGGDPAAPSGNSFTMFGKYRAGRIMPAYIMGSDFGGIPYQPHFMHMQQAYILPVPGATTVTAVRTVSANTVAFTTRTPASGNTFLSATRLSQTTGATAGTSVSWRNSTLQWWRGNAAGLGGFYAVARFGVAANTTNGRGFIGFKDSATILSNGAPSAQTNIIGIGFDSSNATVNTLRIMSANSTVANTIDLGAGFPTNVGNTDWYEAIIYAPPNGGTVQYQVTNLKNGNTAFGSYNQTNLPTTTTFLTWQFWGNNGSDAVALIMDWGGVTIETGF